MDHECLDLDRFEGILGKILPFLDEKSKFCFRKVCKRFKSAVDNEKRQYNLLKVSIFLNKMQLTFKNQHDIGFCIDYLHNPLGCVMEHQSISASSTGPLVTKLVSGGDYVGLALADFRTFVTHPETEVTKFEVMITRGTNIYSEMARFYHEKRRFLTRIEHDFRESRRPVKVETFWITYIGMEIHEREVFAFLPFFELIGEKILYFEPAREAIRPMLHLNYIKRLPQWRSARQFFMEKPFYTVLPPMDWMNFECVSIVIPTLSTRWVQMLIRHYLQSPTFISSIVETLRPNLEINSLYDSIYEIVPPCFNTAPPNFAWIIPNTNGFKVSIMGNNYYFQTPTLE